MIVIGLTGKARSGKDTVGTMLSNLLPSSFVQYSFASPMKAMLLVGLGLRDKEDDKAQELYGCTYRHLAQTLGTEWGRTLIHSDLWVKALETSIRTNASNAVITDVRFANEAAFVRRHGVLIHVTRPDQEDIVESNHISEAGITPLIGTDLRIINDGSLADLSKQVSGLRNHILTSATTQAMSH